MNLYGSTATRSQHGWFLGLTGPQLALVVLGAVPVWLCIALALWTALVPAAVIWAIVVCLVVIKVRGHSAFQWVGVLTRHLVGAQMGWTTWQSKAATGLLDLEIDADEADLPGTLAYLKIHDGPPMPGSNLRPALIQDQVRRAWSLTAQIEHPGIGMLGADERDHLGRAFAELFEGANSPGFVDQIAIQIRSIPDDGTARAAWVDAHRGVEPQICQRIHAQLDEITVGAAIRREAFVTVTVKEDSIARDAKRVARDSRTQLGGLHARGMVLIGVAEELDARLRGALGCSGVRWLESRDLASVIRTGFEPGDAPALADAALHAELGLTVGVPVAAAGPTMASTAMRSYRHGEWTSVSSTVLLPRRGAVIGALALVLVPTQPGERRAFTVFFRPMAAPVADRAVARKQVAAAVGQDLRSRLGRVDGEKQRRERKTLWTHDHNLAHGRVMVTTAAVAAITIPHTWDAHHAGRRLDASIRSCGFTPLPLDGAHDAAFAAAAIPVGIGLPNHRRT